MANIPQFQRSNVNILAGASRQTTDFSGLIAGATQANNALTRYVERQRATDEAMLKVSVDAAYREKRAAYSTLKGGQARGVSTDYIASEKALTLDQVSDIEDPITKSNLEIYTAQKYEQTQEWVTKYQMEQDSVYRAQTLKAINDGIDTDMNDAPTEALLPALDAGVQWSVRQFMEIEDPSKVAIVNYHKAMTNDLYLRHITQRFKEDPVGMVKWWNANKDVISKKVSSAVFNALTDTFNRNEGPAEVMRIYGEVRAKHGNDFLAGAFEVSDPKNFKKYGIEENDYARANQVATMLRNQDAMNRALNKQQKEDREEQKSLEYNQRTAAIAAETDVDARNLMYRNLIREIRLDSDMDQPDREKRIANLEKANYDLNPHKIAYIKAQIDNGTVTRNSQIHANLGDGIGKDTKELETYLKTKQTFDKSGNGEDYMKRARELYMIEATEESTAESRRKGKPVLMKKDIERFMLRLEAKRRAENLTTNNPKILDLYDGLVTQGAYKMKAGKEERIADTTSMWTPNDYLKFKFQTDPEAKVQAELDLMEKYGNSKTIVRQRSGSLGMAIDREISDKDEYKRLLATPRLISGDTVAAKADEQQGKWEVIKGRPMNDAERLKLEATIRKGLDDDGG